MSAQFCENSFLLCICSNGQGQCERVSGIRLADFCSWLSGEAGTAGLRGSEKSREVEQSMDDCLRFFLSLSFQDVPSIPFPQASSWGVLLRPRLSEFVSGFVTEVIAVISTLRLC